MESKQMFISHTKYHKYYSFNILYIFVYHVNALRAYLQFQVSYKPIKKFAVIINNK